MRWWLTSSGPSLQTIQKGWKKNLDAGAPLPQKWLLSPMTRAADTMSLSWGPYIHDETPLFVEVSRNLAWEGLAVFIVELVVLFRLCERFTANRPMIDEGTR